MLKPSESPVKILLADDSVTMHRAVALALKKLPWQLITCDNGQDALRLTIEQRPDVVIADLDMPGMTGAELCQTIRSKPGFAHIRLILLCGSFDQVDEARLEKIPADGRLWKPFESHVLTALIDALLKNASVREIADPTSAALSSVRESSERTLPVNAVPLREASEATAAPLHSSPAPIPSKPGSDFASEMTQETFRPHAEKTLPPAPPVSSLKERILPVPDISAQKAMENLWSPDLAGFDETLPPIPPSPPSTAATEAPSSSEPLHYPDPQPEETEFSVFRDGPQVPLENELPDSHPGYVMDTTQPMGRPLPDLSSMADNWQAGARPTSGMDEESLRRIIREEVQLAFEGRLKGELEKVLAQVIEDIDRS